MPAPPLVSVCIPAYCGGPWIRDAVASALAQTYRSIEVVIVDDHSPDNTLEMLREMGDGRVRLESNRLNIGAIRNWNRCARLARGEFIKYLFQDDLMQADCVEQMSAALLDQPRAGMVFSRREVLLDEPNDPFAAAWKMDYGAPHIQFERLERYNSGRDLFQQYQRHAFRANWVGEPSAVMIRRSSLQRIGLFNTRMLQGADFEMWIRLMFHSDVVFLDEPLATFRVHRGSLSRANQRGNRAWLDFLWLLEGLLQDENIRRECPKLRRMRLIEAARTVRDQWRRVRSGERLDPVGQARGMVEYLRYRLQALAGRAPELHERLTAES
jgi:glycosyltransferase involved in cell wall biosynthesis